MVSSTHTTQPDQTSMRTSACMSLFNGLTGARGRPCTRTNHKLWNPAKEDQREDYYYSLLLLFVPFRDESQLLLPNETAEQAFQRNTSEKGSAHSKKLQRMIEAQATVKRNNEAREQNNVTSNDKDKEEDKGPNFKESPSLT